MEIIQNAQLLCDLGDGDAVDGVLLIRSAERRETRDGAPFLRLCLVDRSGRVPAVLWDADELPVDAGAPVRVVGRLGEHPRYGRQVTITALRAATAEEVCWEHLLDGPRRPAAELERDLDALIASVVEPHLAALLTDLLDRRYREAPAAKDNHHAYRFGLLEHSVQVAQLVSAAAVVFDDVDRDLAVTGALLHDIGKLDAYDDVLGAADLVDAGRLEGEIALGYYRVRRAIEEAPGFPPARARALLHVILAHHGCLEWGSPVAPATREAALVHAIDNLSGTLGAFDRLARETPAGERWSRYDHVLGGAACLRPVAACHQAR